MPVIRFETNGPADVGLVPLELSADDFQSEVPEQNWHIYYEDSDLGLTVGVWTTTSMQEAFGPYPGDEFMVILEGRVAMLDKDDRRTIVNAGETFVVRNGIPISWKQDGFCRKFFMTYLSPDTPSPALETASGGINILDENALQSRLASSEKGNGDEQKSAEVFVNDTGNMHAGMWETEAFHSPMEARPVHEFVQVLVGTVSITEEEGPTHQFSKGDCFFIPARTMCSWHADAPFRKFYCTLSV